MSDQETRTSPGFGQEGQGGGDRDSGGWAPDCSGVYFVDLSFFLSSLTVPVKTDLRAPSSTRDTPLGLCTSRRLPETSSPHLRYKVGSLSGLWLEGKGSFPEDPRILLSPDPGFGGEGFI